MNTRYKGQKVTEDVLLKFLSLSLSLKQSALNEIFHFCYACIFVDIILIRRVHDNLHGSGGCQLRIIQSPDMNHVYYDSQGAPRLKHPITELESC